MREGGREGGREREREDVHSTHLIIFCVHSLCVCESVVREREREGGRERDRRRT